MLGSSNLMANGFVIWGLISALLGFILRFPYQILNGRRNRKRAVGFFHPYTNDGGGGERVLWCAVKAIQEESPDLDTVVYTGDHDASPQSLMGRAIDRFGVKLVHPPKVPTPLSQTITLLVILFLIRDLFGLFLFKFFWVV